MFQRGRYTTNQFSSQSNTFQSDVDDVDFDFFQSPEGEGEHSDEKLPIQIAEMISTDPWVWMNSVRSYFSVGGLRVYPVVRRELRSNGYSYSLLNGSFRRYFLSGRLDLGRFEVAFDPSSLGSDWELYKGEIKHKVGPPVISWFINPNNYNYHKSS